MVCNGPGSLPGAITGRMEMTTVQRGARRTSVKTRGFFANISKGSRIEAVAMLKTNVEEVGVWGGIWFVMEI